MAELPPVPLLSLVVIGAQKSGTSSLMQYMVQHPQIHTHQTAELGYFVNDELYDISFEQTFNTHFPPFSEQAIDQDIFCAKNVWIMTQEKALQRLKAHNPKVQLVLILRNPIDRAYSSFWYAQRKGWEDINNFEKALFANPDRLNDNISRFLNCQYMETGKYIQWIRLISSYFGKNQLHIFLFDDLKKSPLSICQTIFGLFPNLDSTFLPDVTVRHNPAAKNRSKRLSRMMNTRGQYKGVKQFIKRIAPPKLLMKTQATIQSLNETKLDIPPMPHKTRRKLMAYYQPFNDELADFLGKDLSIWNA